MLSRRKFLHNSMAAAAAAAAAGSVARLSATPATAMALPLGLQLYSVREQLPKDWDGTLEAIAKMGYREVEAAGYDNHTAAQVNQSMKNAGLRLVSTHLGFDDLKSHMDEVLDFSHQLGLQYIICPSPQMRNPPPPRPRPTAAQIAAMRAQYARDGGRGRGNGFRPPQFTLDDWKYNAEQFNLFGEKINAAGMRFGYHNHTTEFTKVDGQVPLEVLIQNTDPDKVHFEMDCGWVVVGGGNPVALMRRYTNRFVMIHVKDFKPAAAGATGRARMPSATELGRGEIDYTPIFAEARRIGIQHCFVEQEGFDIPWQQSLEADAAYLRKLGY